MEKKNYTAKYFRDSMPDWKKKKDPMIARLIYRPLSFYISSFCANRGISANSVSFFSIIFSIATCVFFYFNDITWHIIGAVLLNIWLLLDCVDGNIARTVKKQPFGEFADATSCYILLAFVYGAMGYAAYIDGGVLFDKGNLLIFIIGILASSMDILARLINHKFNQGEHEMYEVIGFDKKPTVINISHEPSLLDQIIEAIGIGGYLPLVVLLSSIFSFLDLVVIYTFLMTFVVLVYITFKLMMKSIRLASQYGDEYNMKKN